MDLVLIFETMTLRLAHRLLLITGAKLLIRVMSNYIGY
jgi:hypothetical protein